MKPTTPSDTPPVDRYIAERRLANQLSVAAVQAALVKAAADGDTGSNPGPVPFRVMHQLATGTFDGDAQDLLNRISKDFNQRRKFRDIMRGVAVAYQGRQAAAASHDIGGPTTRPGPMFDLIMSPSSRDDGIVYLQLKFHALTKTGVSSDETAHDGSAPSMLFADRDEHFTVLRLPEVMDGTIQIMLDQSHDIVQAFRDPETEFFIR